MSLEEFLSVFNKFGNDKHEEGIRQYIECVNNRGLWGDLTRIKEDQVRLIVVPFLNKWQCRLSYSCVPNLTKNLRQVEQWIKPLRALSIEQIDFFTPIKYEGKNIELLNLIDNLFENIRKVSFKKRTMGATATSKILHMAVPELFVMNDRRIRKIYGCDDNGAGYVNFMIRMSHFARSLITKAGGDKQNLLSMINIKGYTIARLIDMYNLTRRY